jgi:integrase
MPQQTITIPPPHRGLRFTDAYLAKLKVAAGKDELVLFEAGTGLGVRVSKSGHIGFIVQLRLKDGTRWRDTLGPYGKLTTEAARKAVQALAGEIALGVDPRQKQREAEDAARAKAVGEEAEKFTVGILAERWRRDRLSTKRPDYAVRAYRNVERGFKHLFAMPATSLTRADVRKAIEAMRTQKTNKTGRGSRLSGGPAAIRNAASSLRAAYRWALEEELLDQDPLNGLKLPGRVNSRDRTLTIEEARRFYAAAGRLDYPAQHFIKLLMLTGGRRTEIAELRWDEIEVEDDGTAIVLPPSRTKNNAGHHIPLSGPALAVIDDAKRYRIVGSAYVLTSDGWRSFGNFGRAKSWLDQALADDGGAIAGWTYHDFRRTIVSILAKKPFRFDPVMLDLLLGHQPSRLSAVARIYQREEHHDDRREALEAWAKHLTQPPATVSDLHRERERRN